MNADFEDNTTHRQRQACQLWRRELRARMLALRDNLSPEEHGRLSAQITDRLLHGFFPPAGSIAGFCWPIRNEPDIRPALARWRKQGIRAALPVVVAARSPLRFRAWTPETPMINDIHGIPTPSEGEWLTPDLLLLPLNAFDGAGYRLGYGGGYFDRTLAQLSPRPLTIGIGFEINRVDDIRPQPHDQPLDWIVTEQDTVQIPSGISFSTQVG